VATYNLTSPTGLFAACDSQNLESWLEGEVQRIESSPICGVVRTVCSNLDAFVSFPQKALLLWNGSNRVPEEGKKQKYHSYPDSLKQLAREKSILLDTRPNGPAQFAFLLSGGMRHQRSGSTNSWSIHHLYSGKFEHSVGVKTFHAVKSGLHFSQSAGLVAVHPVADALCDEFACFTWYLRAKAFQRFGYDPDKIFASTHDSLGFAPGHSCDIIYAPSDIAAASV
jgi:hypothetical protein